MREIAARAKSSDRTLFVVVRLEVQSVSLHVIFRQKDTPRIADNNYAWGSLVLLLEFDDVFWSRVEFKL
jgi:hypothetical protein